MTTARSLAFCTALGAIVSACGSSGPARTPTTSADRHVLLNNPAPAFSADRVNGEGKVSLDRWRNKVVLVDFWATWCEPCKKSFPKLEELRNKYGSSGFELVGIAEDDEGPAPIAEFGQSYGARFPLVWDKDKSIARKYSPPHMPSTFIVDKKGVVRHVHLGYHEGEEKVIEDEVRSLL